MHKSACGVGRLDFGSPVTTCIDLNNLISIIISYIMGRQDHTIIIDIIIGYNTVQFNVRLSYEVVTISLVYLIDIVSRTISSDGWSDNIVR